MARRGPRPTAGARPAGSPRWRPAPATAIAELAARLPHGVRDYLPQAAAERGRIVDGLLAIFDRWGYRRIITPAFEYEATLARGLADGAPALPAGLIRFVEPLSGEVAALRPDFTPQVARLVATRLRDEPGPIRLAYEGPVIRMGSAAAPQREILQAGVELVEAPSPGGDVEVISLAVAALAAAGVDGIALDLGEAALVEVALAGVDSPSLRQAIAHKDRDEVARQASRLELSPGQRRLLVALPSLYGGPEVVAAAARLLGRGSVAARRRLDRLAELIRRLADAGVAARISVDLGEVRGWGYYTGMRFHCYADGAADALAAGGRYDHLVERYGRPARAAGFAVDVERVALARRRGAGSRLAARSGWLVAGPGAKAALAALRGRGERALGDLEPVVDRARLLAQADRAGLARLLLANRRGGVVVEVASRRQFALAPAALAALLGGDEGRLAALDEPGAKG